MLNRGRGIETGVALRNQRRHRWLGLALAGLVAWPGWALAQLAEPSIQASAASQIVTLQQIKTAKTAVQDKIDSNLFLALLRQRGDQRLQGLTDYQFLLAEKDGRTPVDIAIASRDGVAAVYGKLAKLGAVVQTDKKIAYEYRTVRARLRLSDLEALAALGEVRMIREAVPAITNATNVSEGDKAHGADQARGAYGATGAGVKVCALSDGVNSLATVQASGDLPPNVDVLPGQAGSGDEGTAMLEIIHDLAPAATLGFATAFNGEGSFAQNIRDLAASGCNIIVDDVFYFDESPFQDGPVAQAVNDVTASGVLYFSSAGNSGNLTDGTSGTWEGDFKASTLANPTPLAGVGPLHDFGNGGQSVQITGSSNSGATLIWAESYDLSGGIASTDYDLYVLNSTLTSVLSASTNRQNGAGGDDVPYERVGSVSNGNRIVISRFATGSTSTPPAIHLSTLRGRIDPAVATAGTIGGHSSTQNGYGVAATPAGPAVFNSVPPVGPYPNQFTSGNASESFSSDGPRRVILSPTGVELTPGNRTFSGGVVRQQPIITAADGVSTAAPGFNPFFGTSAAAPHAAAIAALLKSGLPSLTPAQVRTALTSTAIDIEAPGVDRTTGYGIVMPTPALQSVGATPQAFLAAGSPAFTQVSGDGDANIEPNETWKLRVPLTNTGAASATGISATLSTSTPGVTITTASAPYPNIAASATATNSSSFVFKLGPSYPCGTPISFSEVVSYSGANSPQSLPVSAATGGLGAFQSYAYSGSPVPIPDGVNNIAGANADAPLAVSGLNGPVGAVKLTIAGSSCSTTAGSTTVGIDHTYVSDLRIRLIAPDGTTVPVISAAGGSGHNFCQTALDDQSTGPNIDSQPASAAPFTGSFKPSSPLSAFRGVAGNGTWKLQAQDFFAADTGNIRAFSVAVAPVICDAPVPVPTISVADTSIAEGDSGTTILSFKVKLSSAAAGPVTVKYATADGTATAGSDYVAKTGTLTFDAGITSKTLKVTVNGDTTFEPDETVLLNLSAPTGATISDAQAVGTITNDDPQPLPTLSINDVRVTEGNSGTVTAKFSVKLSAASATDVTVRYATANGTATAGSDYTAKSGTLTFAAGTTSKSVSISVTGDTSVEPNETFLVNLSSPSGATIADGQGIGTIVNDD